MKTIKLEVGKTYRSREGEEVKIVVKHGVGMSIYEGSNGNWYTESGRFDYRVEESPYDLIEEVPSETTRHTFDIPKGVKKVTVEQVGNRIVVEMVPEEKAPKPGDVMINERGSVYIFKSVRDSGAFHNLFAWIGKNGRLSLPGWCYPGRPATPKEAQPLWDALKKAGKRWNPETMQVEDVADFYRILEWVEEHLNDGRYTHKGLAQVIEEYLKHKEGEK